MSASILLSDTYKPANEFACTGRIHPTHATTFLFNAYPTVQTNIFTVYPEGPATPSVAERKEEAPTEGIAAIVS